MPGKSGGGNGIRTAKRAAARENRVPSRSTRQRRAKEAREAAAAEDHDNVGQDPLPDDFGDVDIHDIGGADNGDVSAGLGAGTSAWCWTSIVHNQPVCLQLTYATYLRKLEVSQLREIMQVS